MSRQRVASISDVPPGAVRVVECNGRSLALSNVDGEFAAIDNRCTHDDGPLGEGDARTGKVISLPAVRDVASYDVTVDGGDIYIECAAGDGQSEQGETS